MKESLLSENLQIIVDSEGSVDKIRKFILEQAVRGRLVPQDPKDEPASVLLEKIRKEKKLIKKEKIKKEKPLPEIKPNELQFEIPKGWKWIRLGDIFTFNYGKGIHKNKRVDKADYPVHGANGIMYYHNQHLTSSRAIIIGRKGSAGAVNLSLIPSWPSDVTYFVEELENMDLFYMHYLFKSLDFPSLAKGIKPGLNRNEVYKTIFALPPLAEQHRIVEKVDKLMSLCDKIEKAKSLKSKSYGKLVESAIYHLLESKSQKEFNRTWHFIHSNFALLAKKQESIELLKKAVLQLAIQGKLVPQNPGDEPASVLLEKIKAEKEKLVSEGKIRKEKPLPPITEEEIPYELPKGWEWVKFGECFPVIRGASPRPKGDPQYFSDKRTDYHWIMIADIRLFGKGNTLTDTKEFLTEKGMKKSVLLPRGTLILTNSATIAVPIFLGFDGGCIHDGYLAFPYLDKFPMDLNYVYYYFLNFRSHILNKARGLAQLNINTSILKNTLFPLPPLAEQHRIVEKVDKLMSLCDQLEEKVRENQKNAELLMDAVLREAFQEPKSS